MKKYGKIIIALFALFGLLFAKNYILFDHQPFDDLKTGEIEKVYLFTDGNTEHHEVFDYSAFTDRIDELELIKRTTETNQEHQGCVSVTIYYTDGSEERFSVTPDYIHTDNGIYIGEREESTEFLKYAFRLTLFDRNTIGQSDESRVDELIQLAIEGNDENEIRNYAKNALLSDGLSDDTLKSFANQGYSPIDIFVLKADVRQRMESDARYQTKKVQYKLLVEQLWNDYKNNNIIYQHPYKRPPSDFVFGDIFTDKAQWDTMEFQQNEMGYFYTLLPSADGKYYMTVTIDDNGYENMFGTVKDDPPFIRFVDFYLQSESAVPADYPPIDIIKSDTALETANILTEKLTNCISLDSLPEQPVFSKNMFLCIIHYIDNPDFCYYNIFPLLQSSFKTQFKTTNMEKVIQQVIGDYKWKAEKDFFTDSEFNEETQSYEFSTDFGWGVQFYQARNISSNFSADRKQVYSTFEMIGPDKSITTDPAHKSYGNYRAVFDIITENDETFLRFNRYEKI